MKAIVLFMFLTVGSCFSMESVNRYNLEQYREYSTEVLSSVESEQEKKLLTNLAQSILDLKQKHRCKNIGKNLKTIWKYGLTMNGISRMYFLINAGDLIDYYEYDLQFDVNDLSVKNWINKIEKASTIE